MPQAKVYVSLEVDFENRILRQATTNLDHIEMLWNMILITLSFAIA
jgi:hypothetical protein